METTRRSEEWTGIDGHSDVCKYVPVQTIYQTWRVHHAKFDISVERSAPSPLACPPRMAATGETVLCTNTTEVSAGHGLVTALGREIPLSDLSDTQPVAVAHEIMPVATLATHASSSSGIAMAVAPPIHTSGTTHTHTWADEVKKHKAAAKQRRRARKKAEKIQSAEQIAMQQAAAAVAAAAAATTQPVSAAAAVSAAATAITITQPVSARMIVV